jgi:transcriptional regulator GlxA family with amidase domain
MQRVGFVLFDGFHVITFAAMAVFEVANKTLDEPRYDLRLLSEMGGLIQSSHIDRGGRRGNIRAEPGHARLRAEGA